MQANWSLILNILLLTGVVVAIVRMLRTKKIAEASIRTQPSMGVLQNTDKASDDVIAVRKVMRESSTSMHGNISSQTNIHRPAVHSNQSIQHAPSSFKNTNHISTQEILNGHKSSIRMYATQPKEDNISPNNDAISMSPQLDANEIDATGNQMSKPDKNPQILVIFLLAKANRQLAGYELLQTILAAGLRFGEGHLFHRHQFPNGQGPVLCSLATATPGGVFDLQNIGAFSVHGLCLFMQTSGNITIDLERLSIMVDTAKQLSEGLDTHMLDETRNAWSDETQAHYESMLSREIREETEESI